MKKKVKCAMPPAFAKAKKAGTTPMKSKGSSSASSEVPGKTPPGLMPKAGAMKKAKAKK